MTCIGIVKTKIDNKVTISVLRKGSCGENCAACNGCQNTDVTVKANCDIAVNIGDTVEISSKTSDVLFGMFMIFIFPLILPLTLYLLFYNFGNIVASVITCFSILISLVMILKLSKSQKYISKITPTVVRVVHKY